MQTQTIPGPTDGERSGTPRVSMVVNTYNRIGLVGRAIASVQAQTVRDLELLVVDDGSTDGTYEHVLALRDEAEQTGGTLPFTVVEHPGRVNRGLTASRNIGARQARGEWLAFLDDDDEVEPQWLERLLAAIRPDVGIVFCGHERVSEKGAPIELWMPRPLGGVLGDVEGSYWGSTWLMRRDVFERCGGYLEGLPFIHQFELLARAVQVCTELGLTTAAVHEPLMRYTVRDHDNRPMQWPQLGLDGGRWILARHAQAFAADRATRADHNGVVGVAAIRMGRFDLGRRHLWRSFTAQPTDPRRLGRLLAAVVPWVARRLWGKVSTASGGQRLPLPLVHDLAELHASPEDHLFLPWRYERNPQASADSEGMPYWEEPSLNNTLYQEPVYRWAAQLVRRGGWSSVLDVGTGSGVKLEKYLLPVTPTTVGFDQGSGIALARTRCPAIEWIDGDLMADADWQPLAGRRFDLLVCADVIEHVEQPVFLLRRLAELLADGGQLLISTPDRMRFDLPTPLGPPNNSRHVREWTRDEFELLLESVGLQIVDRRRFLPRGYRLTLLEVKRIVWRVLHLQAVPDRRSNTAWLCRSAGASEHRA
jgi:SAM-dependent methyltransferase